MIQVSDCHVSADPDADYRGQSASRNLARLLPAVRARASDLLLLTGDVSEDGSEASYQRVAAALEATGLAVHALPGNHDDPETMRRHFPLGPWTGPHVVDVGRWRIILLDSTRAGDVSGFFSRRELEDFERAARAGQAEHLLVGLHHQPLLSGSPWIDRYALRHRDEFLDRLDAERRLRCVVWGHIHQDFRTRRGGVAMLGAPSSAVNSLPRRERFTTDPRGPACRWLELVPDGEVRKGILFAEK